MAEIERLEILIDVVDRFSDELDQLLIKLAEVEAVAERVDRITIDVDVRGEHELDALMARLAAVGAFDAGTVDVDVGARGGVARGGAATAAQTADATSEATESLTKAADALDNMAESGDLLNLRMSDLHNLLAKLVPIILTFIGALPALIAGLVVLATAAVAAASALFALAGFGALGFALARGGPENLMEGFSQLISEIRSDFLDAFAPLAERLAPLFEDAIDGLDMLFQRIADQGQVLVDFADEARDFGAFMLEFIPNLLADMGRMAEAFAPLFGAFMDLFDFNVLRAFTVFMADAADEMILFTKLLIAFIPQIVEMSMGFLQVVNVLGAVIQGIISLISWIVPLSGQHLGALIGTILTLITVLSLWRTIQAAQIIPTIAATMPALAALVASIDVYIINALMAAGASVVLAEAISLLLIATGIGAALLAVGAIVGVAAEQFSNMTTDIQGATSALREFDKTSRRLGDTEAKFGVDPSTARRRGRPSRGGSVVVNVEGDADKETTRKQARNATYRLQRPRQSGA